jgi:plasmid stability protein
MGTTAEILAELEELGATGKEKDIPIRAVEEVSIEKGSPSPRLLDERGRKMIALSDLVIEEFDRLIESAMHIRSAVAEMRDMWKASPVEESVPADVDQGVEGEEETEDEGEEAEDPAEERYPTGVPSPTGTIAITIPESEPLPPEVQNLTDADLSNPPVDFDREEHSNEGENDDGQIPETS